MRLIRHFVRDDPVALRVEIDDHPGREEPGDHSGEVSRYFALASRISGCA